MALQCASSSNVEVRAQRIGELRQRADRTLQPVVVSHEECLDGQRRRFFLDPVRIARRADDRGEVGLLGAHGFGRARVEAQQLDLLQQFGVHVLEELRGLAGHDDRHVDLAHDQLGERVLVAVVLRVLIGDRLAEHQPVERRRRLRRAAADQPDADVLVLDLMDVLERRIRAHHEIDLLVVERHDEPQRLDDLAGVGVARGRHVEVRLVDVGLDQRELHVGFITHALDVFRRSFRRQHFQVDPGRIGNPFRKILADLDIRAALGSGHDLVLDVGGERFRRDTVKPAQDEESECPAHEFRRVHVLPLVSELDGCCETHATTRNPGIASRSRRPSRIVWPSPCGRRPWAVAD